MSKWIKGSDYDYKPCEHNKDPILCAECGLFDEGIEIVDHSSLWDKIKDPLGYWRIRKQIKKVHNLGRRL